jgi:hypothetical protein
MPHKLSDCPKIWSKLTLKADFCGRKAGATAKTLSTKAFGQKKLWKIGQKQPVLPTFAALIFQDYVRSSKNCWSAI